MNNSVKFATEEDLDKVLEIEQLSFIKPWDYTYFKTALKDIFIVFEQVEIVGFLVACLCELTKEATILKIAVHHNHRGKGVAKTLIKTALQILSKKNIDEVKLDVDVVKSGTKIYEKFGFKITKVVSFINDMEDDSFFIMKLKLSKS